MPQFDIFEFSRVFLWFIFFFIFFYIFFSNYFLPIFLKVFKIRDYAVILENKDSTLLYFTKYYFYSFLFFKNLFFIDFNTFTFTFLVYSKN